MATPRTQQHVATTHRGPMLQWFYALILAAVIAFLYSSALPKSAPPDSLAQTLGFTLLVLHFTLALTAAFYSLSLPQHQTEKRLGTHLLPLSNLVYACISAVELLKINGQISDTLFYYLNFFAYLTLTASFTLLVVHTTKLSSQWSQLLAYLNCVAFTLFGVLGLFSKQWFNLVNAGHFLALVHTATIAALPLVIYAVSNYQSKMPQQFGPERSLNPEVLEAERDPSKRAEGRLAVFIVISQFMFFALNLFVRGIGTDSVRAALPFAAMSLLWLGSFAYTFVRLQYLTAFYFQQSLLGALSAAPARKYLLRHYQQQRHWAATTGLRAPIMFINHDPDDILQESLPVNLRQIRQQEIHRCFTQLLRHRTLAQQNFGQHVFAVIDPEFGPRPALESMKIFAAIQLELMPILERRLATLGQLLPILDPGLTLPEPHLMTTLQKIPWIMYLDFDWIDQQLIHTPKHIAYDLVIPSVFTHAHSQQLAVLRDRLGSDPFIWLSAEARNRLTSEAPQLAELCYSLKSLGISAKSQLNHASIIMVQDLTKRLDAYFDLSSVRQTLADYPASERSLRQLRSIEAQLVNCHDATQVSSVIAVLDQNRLQWQGFTEKDMALRLLRQAYDRLKAMGAYNEQLVTRMALAINNIGYPGQTLHAAQLKQYARRNLAMLVATINDPTSPHFYYAWTLLATTDVNLYEIPDLEQIVNVLQQIPFNGSSQNQIPYITAKALETFANICAHPRLSELNGFDSFCDIYGALIAKSRPPVDVLLLFLDVLCLLNQKLNIAMPLSSETIPMLTQYIEAMAKSGELSSAQHDSILRRWRDLSNQQVDERRSQVG